MDERLTGPAKTAPILLAACCALPVVQTLVAVHLQWVPVITYPALKALMIVTPIAVWRWSRRSMKDILQRTGLKRTNLSIGLLVGVLMGGAVLGAYYAVFRATIAPGPLLTKIASLGLAEHYWSMVIVISFLNALLEEYYWRGFLLSELGDRINSRALTCVVCGGLFGLHHVLALAWLPSGWLIAMGASATVVAGVVWAWLRIRGTSILDCYISHLLVDLSVMWIGYDMMLRAG